MARREGRSDARSSEDTCSRLYTASIEGEKQKSAKSSSFIILDSFPDYYSQENSLGTRLLTTRGGGAHLMVHDLRKWNQLLAELARNLLFI